MTRCLPPNRRLPLWQLYISGEEGALLSSDFELSVALAWIVRNSHIWRGYDEGEFRLFAGCFAAHYAVPDCTRRGPETSDRVATLVLICTSSRISQVSKAMFDCVLQTFMHHQSVPPWSVFSVGFLNSEAHVSTAHGDSSARADVCIRMQLWR